MVRTIKRRHFGAFALLVAVALLCVLASSSEAAQEEEPNPLIPDQLPNSEVVPGQIIVKYGKRTTPAEKAALRQEENLDKKVELSLIDAEVVKVEGRTTAAALRDLNRRSDVEYAEFDYVYQAF